MKLSEIRPNDKGHELEPSGRELGTGNFEYYCKHCRVGPAHHSYNQVCPAFQPDHFRRTAADKHYRELAKSTFKGVDFVTVPDDAEVTLIEDDEGVHEAYVKAWVKVEGRYKEPTT